MEKEVRMIIADEQKLFVEGLKCLIMKILPEVDQVHTVGCGKSLLEKALLIEPDLVLLNVRMPEIDGFQTIASLKENHPHAKVIVVSEYDQSKFIKMAFECGADGYLLKSSSGDDLKRCVVEVTSGQTYMGNGVSIGALKRKKKSSAARQWEHEDAFIVKSNLTPREVEILSHIAEDKNNKEIAVELYISDQTVGVHRKNIMKKLNATTTESLIKMAHDFGLIR